MSLSNKLNKLGFFRRLVYFPLVAGLISLSSCTKDSSSPSGPSGGGNGGGGNNGGYVEDTGNTNGDGELKLEVDGKKFNFYVQDKDDGHSLNNIRISGAYFLNNIYSFLAEDFSYNYFSNVIYVDLNSTYSTSGENVGTIDINQELNKIRGREYLEEHPNQDEPYIYNLSNNPNLTFLATIPSDELHDFYDDNDAILANISILEFIKDNGLYSHPALDFALEANGFREKFIDNLNNYNDWVNRFASLFGGSFEKEALYLDIYKNKLGVLTHQVTTKGNYITLKGRVYNGENQNRINGACVNITRGPVLRSTNSDDAGRYFLKFLIQGVYDFSASYSGFNNDEPSKLLSFFDYTQPRCDVLDFYLTPEHHVTLDTLILQPGPSEGKDASVLSLNPTTNYGDGDFLNVAYNPWGNGDIWRSYSFLDISSIPQNSTIRSAKLYMRGASGQDGEGLDDAYIAIKKVLDNWNESQINWNNQPRFNSHTYATSIFSHWPDYEWKSFDLVDLIQEWVSSSNNKGIAIVLDQEYGRRTAAIYSSDISNADFRYKLEVVYEH